MCVVTALPLLSCSVFGLQKLVPSHQGWHHLSWAGPPISILIKKMFYSLSRVGSFGHIFLLAFFFYFFLIFNLLIYFYLCKLVFDMNGFPSRVSDALELELQRDVNCHVGAWNQTHFLWKSSQCSEH